MFEKTGKKSFLLLTLGALLFFCTSGAAEAETGKTADEKPAPVGSAGFIAPEDRLLAAREAEAGRIEAFRKAREERAQALKAAQLAREEAARDRANGKWDASPSAENEPAAER